MISLQLVGICEAVCNTKHDDGPLDQDGRRQVEDKMKKHGRIEFHDGCLQDC